LNKAVFLDRDGVINKPMIIDGKSYAPRSLKDFKIFPKVKNDVKKLKNKGFKVFVITNQPDIGNKLIKKKTLQEMHRVLKKKVPIDKIYYCPHTRSDKCKCRKPKPGMIIEASKESKIYLKESYLVGDRKTDIDAGLKVGCKTIFVENDYYEKKPVKQEKTVKSLHAAVKYILKKEN
jgi:D-glycero-D-manno-heptose 1,7-bisphosphate phosphatase